MAIADLDAYLAKLKNPEQIPMFKKASDGTASALSDGWLSANGTLGGAAPTTAVVPTKDTVGALEIVNGTKLRVFGAHLAGNMGTYVLCDRLSHQGGLSGTSATAQTTNLPTAALTRYTNGVGVMAGLSIYSAIGATGTTIQMSYTNSDSTPTSGRTSPARTWGNTVRNASLMALMPLQEGDTGVTSVESVTAAASTTTAGNFGVTLFKPLCAFSVVQDNDHRHYSWLDGMLGQLPEILDDACLFWLRWPFANATVGLNGSLYIGEE